MDTEFNADDYRNKLRNKLGNKTIFRPTQTAIGTVNPQTSAITPDSGEFGNDGGGEAVSPEVLGLDQEIDSADQPSENDKAQLAPAIALLDSLLQLVDEQTHGANDKAVSLMWRSLYMYITKNQNKIAKKMFDDAKAQ